MSESSAKDKHRYALRILFAALLLITALFVGIAVVTGESVVSAVFFGILGLGLNLVPWGAAWWVCRRRKISLDVPEIRRLSIHYTASIAAVSAPLFYRFLPTTGQLMKEVMEAAEGKINTLVGFGFGRTPLELWGLLGAMAAWVVLAGVGRLIVADNPAVEAQAGAAV
jgi:hypothetical protein